MENQYVEPIAELLRQVGLTEQITWQTQAIVLAGILLLSWLTAVLFRRLVIPALQKISSQTKVTWDDHLFKDEIMHDLCRLLPPLIWYVLLPVAFPDQPVLLSILRKGSLIYLIVAALVLVRSFLNTLYEISNEHETLRNRPLKGIYQMFKLIAVCIGGILIISILIDRDATSILAGLGASAAVLMLIFRDSILGLVAGVQLSANDMLRPGDWITMSKYGADGYVTEVSLTTVKVQNFDKTITTIPPYALVSDSFQNWRGMLHSDRCPDRTALHGRGDRTFPQSRLHRGRGTRRRGGQSPGIPGIPDALPQGAAGDPAGPAPDGPHAAADDRGHPHRGLLLHGRHRMDRLRADPKRTVRPPARHAARIRACRLPASRRPRLPHGRG